MLRACGRRNEPSPVPPGFVAGFAVGAGILVVMFADLTVTNAALVRRVQDAAVRADAFAGDVIRFPSPARGIAVRITAPAFSARIARSVVVPIQRATGVVHTTNARFLLRTSVQRADRSSHPANAGQKRNPSQSSPQKAHQHPSTNVATGSWNLPRVHPFHSVRSRTSSCPSSHRPRLCRSRKTQPFPR